MPKKISFITSAVLAKDFPEHRFNEIAIAGRSNAGKSSFINALSLAKIAKVSSTPGKTTLLNFFNVDNSYVLVDMPGYGFAARSNRDTEDWQRMIEEYLTMRDKLKGLILVMDIRREWAQEEEMMKSFCSANDIPMAIVLMKADKLTRNHVNQAIQKMKQASRLELVYAGSSLERKACEATEDSIYRAFLKESE